MGALATCIMPEKFGGPVIVELFVRVIGGAPPMPLGVM